MNKPSILEYIKGKRVNSTYYTHVTLDPKGKYQLNQHDMDKFMTNYCDAIYQGDECKTALTIAERPQQYLPILVDLDIKKRIQNSDRDSGQTIEATPLHYEAHVMSMVSIYQAIIKNMVCGCTEDTLSCVVLSKPAYVSADKKYIKHGFHLHFPWLFLKDAEHKECLIPKIKELVDECQDFINLKVQGIEFSVDEGYIRTPWLMYKAHKPGGNSYSVSKVYGENCELIPFEEAFKDYEVYDSSETRIKFDRDIFYYIPRILSTFLFGRNALIKECKTGTIISSTIKSIKGKKTHADTCALESIDEARKIMPMLGDYRATEYNEWMTIGWVLYNIGNGSKEAFDLWIDFSRRSDKFNEAECISRWKGMYRMDYTIATLKYFAGLDSPEEYKKHRESVSQKYMLDAINGSHNALAKMLFQDYGTEFACASISKKAWYHFNDHIWERCDDGVYLREKISSTLPARFIAYGQDLFLKMASVDEEEKLIIGQKIAKTQKLISNLGKAGYKNNVFQESMEVFYSKAFLLKLNTDPYLIAFQNGVYDLRKKIFRDGRPEDYISMKMGVKYTDFAQNDGHVQDVFEFLQKVLPDISVREYFMTWAASVFVGGNRSKKVLVWSGENGDNAKSTLESMLEQMFGQYAIKFPTTLITGKRTQAGATCSELARAGNGVRLAVLQEPDNKEVINIGMLKELSGNDSFFVRGLYQEGSEIHPLFKLILVCNVPPKIPSDDRATWNRIRVVPFESTFCHDAPETFEEQLLQKRFPIDVNFADRIPDMLEALAWILLEQLKKPMNLDDPEKVTLATSRYRTKNDMYRQFADEMIVICDDEKSGITLVELYGVFKDWYKEAGYGSVSSTPTRNDLQDYFVKLWGDMERKSFIGWYGRKIYKGKDLPVGGDIASIMA